MAAKKTTYLGARGYTILKSDLNEEEELKLRKENTVKPFSPKHMVQTQTTEFPVYRESTTKFYLPRYWAQDAYGLPKDCLLKTPTTINLVFSGELRDYQYKISDKYCSYAKRNGGGLLEMDTGLGKTVLALYILSQLGVKTMVVVHKEFLMNQWLERIQQFLPDARVGFLQGKKEICDDVDITIAMLQTLSMKTHDLSMFSSFGLTIYDEVHHMGAEVFSRALSKVVTRYTLGLSATMERKDGLSKVFKYFLGPIVHTEKRKQENNNVHVHKVTYSVGDEEFNETKYDYRGNPAYSSMITKLCSYGPRSDFIVNVIETHMRENIKQQIIVLAHNKSLLTYLHDAIRDRTSLSVGYYVGGMKDKDRKASEDCQVIIATYSMAAEGLDIKSLTTLLMATPKTDIVQAVGRILRVKHQQPLVIDIVDTHDVFQRQWVQRRRFYNKQNYEMFEISNHNFSTRNYSKITKSSKTTKTTKTASAQHKCQSKRNGVLSIISQLRQQTNCNLKQLNPDGFDQEEAEEEEEDEVDTEEKKTSASTLFRNHNGKCLIKLGNPTKC